MPKRVLIVLVVLGLGWIVYVHLTSDERRIRRRLAAFVHTVEKTGPEDQLASAGAARRAATFFAPGFVVRAEPYEGVLTDPQELVAAVLRLRTTARVVEVDVDGLDIEVRANRTAVASFVAAVTLDLGDRRGEETWRVRCEWLEEGGEWLVHGLELVEPVEGGRYLPVGLLIGGLAR